MIQRLPSEYFGTNVFIGASAMSKPEIRRRYANGLDALMWGTDYPHPEGTWPNTVDASQHRLPEVPVEETRLLLGLNAVRCYDLDLDALASHRSRHRAHARASSTRTSPLRTPPDAIREARFWFDDYGIEWKD